MFGYVVCNQSELKFREYDVYRSYYCGLCRVLKESYGASGQLTLSYDLTFLVMLLSGLYEPEEEEGVTRCLVHPFVSHPTRISKYTQYAADLNVILSYYSCRDDWEDEKKLRSLLLSTLLKGKEEKAKDAFADKAALIRDRLLKLRKCEEKNDTDIDRVSGLFGDIMAECFAAESDVWEDTLRRMGFFLGKYIYIMDAYEDLAKDLERGSYNPLTAVKDRSDYEEYVRQILVMMMAECCKTFETLPILKNVEILRNILYSGVWSRYGELQKKKGGDEHVGSL